MQTADQVVCRGGRSHIFTLRLRSCSKNFNFLSGSKIFSNLRIPLLFDQYNQNRRQKVFNRGALRFCWGLWACAGGLDTLKIGKISTDL